MRRPLLVSTMVLGTIVTALGGMGVFAPFTDRATTGPNSVTSGERPKAADLKLAYDVSGTSACATATYADNTTTAGHSLSDAQPGSSDSRWFCLRNVGSASLAASLTVIDLVDVDHACTGDEAAAGDTTCGGDQEGELKVPITVEVAVMPCDGSPGPVPTGNWIDPAPTFTLGTLTPNATMCGFVRTLYARNRTTDEVLRAQSDTLTWRYAFDGTTS